MLIIILFLPHFDLLSQFFLGLLLLLSLTTHFGDCAFKLLNFDVFELSILLRGQIFHRLEQLLLLAFDLDIVGRHVFILVLLQHLGQVLIETLNASVDAHVSLLDLLPELLRLVRDVRASAVAAQLCEHDPW